MAEKSSTSPLAKVRTSPSRPPRTLNRLRKRFSKENKSSSNLLGAKIKRFSEFENYSGCSRGTLGGFLPLPDMGSPYIDSLSLEKQTSAEKECVLTHLTRKIGLGIYTRGHDIAAEKQVRERYVDIDGDERETWYMFYPPPPSPSLVLEPKNWDSASSPEPESVSSSPQSLPIVISEDEVEGEDQPPLSVFTKGSQYATSNPTSAVSPTIHRHIQRETNQDIDIDALILSAETLAKQYRGLLFTPTATPRLTSFHPNSENGLSPPPFPSQIPSPLSLNPPTRPQTPKTLRKIKRQHSLRKLIDGANPASLPSPTTMASTPIRPQTTTATIDMPLTPPPSATKSTTPLTPPEPLRSPYFWSSTFTPKPLPPTRLSLAGHPNRSPTPGSQGRGGAEKRKKKMGRDFDDAFEAPEPPPRESSRARSGRGGGRGKDQRRKEKEKVRGGGGGGGGDAKDMGGAGGGKGREREGNCVGDRDGGRSRGVGKDRGRTGEMRRYGVSDVAKTGGGVNEGGEGWL